MDSLITAASRALAAGDPLGALKRVALRDDAAALALRGIAMARLGDLDRARALLKRARRAFSPREVVARARCVVAEAEIALVSRDLGWAQGSLAAARGTLESHGDSINAAHARHIEIRRLALTGRLDEAERMLPDIDVAQLPPTLKVAHELVVAGIATRRLRTKPAREALARAEAAARRADVPVLLAEVQKAALALEAPAARVVNGAEERPLRLEEVEALMASDALIVDACRYAVRGGGAVVSLANRPVLFNLARALSEAWPGDVSREALVLRAFRVQHLNDSHRARLRVEIGRLRKSLKMLVRIEATERGFRLTAMRTREVVTVAPPVDEADGPVLALLADGEAWSSSALALALDTSPRTVQRALEQLASAGKAQSYGNGRARRWTTPPLAGFTTVLLLPGPLPFG